MKLTKIIEGQALRCVKLIATPDCSVSIGDVIIISDIEYGKGVEVLSSSDRFLWNKNRHQQLFDNFEIVSDTTPVPDEEFVKFVTDNEKFSTADFKVMVGYCNCDKVDMSNGTIQLSGRYRAHRINIICNSLHSLVQVKPLCTLWSHGNFGTGKTQILMSTDKNVIRASINHLSIVIPTLIKNILNDKVVQWDKL